MWTLIAVVAVVVGIAALVWRLLIVPQRTPNEIDRSRQHEVPGADRPPPCG